MAKKTNDDLDDLNNIEPIGKESYGTRLSASKNALLKPCFLLLVCIWLSCASFIAWMEIDFSKKNATKSIDNFAKSFNETIEDIVNIHFADTQQQLDRLAKNIDLQNALLTKDETILLSLSSLLKNSFKNAAELQIIPLDDTVTAGLKTREQKERSSVDLLMLTLIGGQKAAKPEAYQDDKQWLFSFITPVIFEDRVIGAIHLTLTTQFLEESINKPFFTDAATMTLLLNDQPKNPIAVFGKPTTTQTYPIAVPYTNGQLLIQLSSLQIAKLSPSYIPMYIGLACLAFVLSLFTIISYRLSRRYILKDVEAIKNYAESLSALHKIQQPDLLVRYLSPILNDIDSMNARAAKSAIVIESNNQKKSVQSGPPPKKMGQATVSESHEFMHGEIFRDYDIRGLADSQLTTDTVVMIGKAIGSEAISMGIREIVVGRDGRLSSEKIQFDLIKGLKATGCNVINISQVPTPILYFATHQFSTGSGVMITGSHNPAEYNGMKIMLDNQCLRGEQIKKLLHRIEKYDFIVGEGNMTNKEIKSEYREAVSADILITKPIKVVIDAANGVGGEIALSLFTSLDCETIPLYCNVDGSFPNHSPDPSIASNLSTLINTVRENNADLGIAFDGDADRMVAVSSSGQIIAGDHLLMLFAKDIVSRNPASNIVYDIKCSRNVNKIITEYGGHAVMCKAGHSNVKARMQECNAIFGGELTGHFFFKERWLGFDDGIYSALRLIELITGSDKSLDDMLKTLPKSYITNEIIIPLTPAQDSSLIISTLKSNFIDANFKIDTLDGVRVEFSTGWGLVRASNTTHALSTRFEADDGKELARIRSLVQKALQDISPDLSLLSLTGL